MYYFIGIKGSGMAALASIVHDLGYEVEGSDIDKHFFTEEGLIKRGIKIHTYNGKNIKEGMTIVRGNAIKDDNEELKKAEVEYFCEIFNVFMSLINHFLIVGAKIHKRIELQA